MRIKFIFNTGSTWVEGIPPEVGEIINIMYKGQKQKYRVKSASKYLEWYDKNSYSEYYTEVGLEYIEHK